MKLLWILFWELVFVMFILPWAWFPIVLGFWEYYEPKWVRWVLDQACGNFK